MSDVLVEMHEQTSGVVIISRLLCFYFSGVAHLRLNCAVCGP